MRRGPKKVYLNLLTSQRHESGRAIALAAGLFGGAVVPAQIPYPDRLLCDLPQPGRVVQSYRIGQPDAGRARGKPAGQPGAGDIGADSLHLGGRWAVRYRCLRQHRRLCHSRPAGRCL